MDTLVLNATYEVIKIVNWKQAVKLYFLDKVEVIEQYERPILTPSLNMNVPAVVKFKKVVKNKYKGLKLTRLNIFFRDQFTCQYCQTKVSRTKLTMDHITPKSKGGKTSWTNCVACCIPCNVRKGSKTLKESSMKLMKEPKQPLQTDDTMMLIQFNTDVPTIWKTYSFQKVA